MESASDPGGSMDTESDTGKLGDLNEGLLLRLPVEVYRRVLNFVAYSELLFLSRCNRHFRKCTTNIIACAGRFLIYRCASCGVFRGLPEIDRLLCPLPQAFRVLSAALGLCCRESSTWLGRYRR